MFYVWARDCYTSRELTYAIWYSRGLLEEKKKAQGENTTTAEANVRDDRVLLYEETTKLVALEDYILIPIPRSDVIHTTYRYFCGLIVGKTVNGTRLKKKNKVHRVGYSANIIYVDQKEYDFLMFKVYLACPFRRRDIDALHLICTSTRGEIKLTKEEMSATVVRGMRPINRHNDYDLIFLGTELTLAQLRKVEKKERKTAIKIPILRSDIMYTVYLYHFKDCLGCSLLKTCRVFCRSKRKHHNSCYREKDDYVKAIFVNQEQYDFLSSDYSARSDFFDKFHADRIDYHSRNGITTRLIVGDYAVSLSDFDDEVSELIRAENDDDDNENDDNSDSNDDDDNKDDDVSDSSDDDDDEKDDDNNRDDEVEEKNNVRMLC
jgi:hypothetical protein